LKADLGEGENAIASILPEYRESRLRDLQEKWPQSRLVHILLNTPFNLTFIQLIALNWAEDSEYGDAVEKPGSPSSRLTPIPNWSIKDFFVNFSEKTITYEAEIASYYIDKTTDKRNAFVKKHPDLWQVVQPVDIAKVTKLRKVYQLKDAHSWPASYTYFIFGFTLN
jgi:hypothetical protein